MSGVAGVPAGCCAVANDAARTTSDSAPSAVNVVGAHGDLSENTMERGMEWAVVSVSVLTRWVIIWIAGVRHNVETVSRLGATSHSDARSRYLVGSWPY